jgi:uncharacterized membrane protein YedE/YeeE
VSLFVILLLAVALVTGILGVIVEGIAWVVVIALALFVGGIVLGWIQRRRPVHDGWLVMSVDAMVARSVSLLPVVRWADAVTGVGQLAAAAS